MAIPVIPAYLMATMTVAIFCGVLSSGLGLLAAFGISLVSSLGMIWSVRWCITAGEGPAPDAVVALDPPAAPGGHIQRRSAILVTVAWLCLALACSVAMAHVASFDAVLGLHGEGASNPLLARARSIYETANPVPQQNQTRAQLVLAIMLSAFVFWLTLGIRWLSNRYPGQRLLPVCCAATVSLVIGMGIFLNHTSREPLRVIACNDVGMMLASAKSLPANAQLMSPIPEAQRTSQQALQALHEARCSN